MTNRSIRNQDAAVFSLRSLEHLKPVYEQIARAYYRAWGLQCVLANAHGAVVAGSGIVHGDAGGVRAVAQESH